MRPRGAVLLAASATALVCALSTGSSLYYLASFSLAGVWLMALLSVVLSMILMYVHPITKSIQAVRGESVTLRLLVSTNSVLPVGEIKVGIRSSLAENDSGEIRINPPLFRAKEYRYSLQCPHRGSGTAQLAYVKVTDIFNIFSWKWRLHEEDIRLKIEPRRRDAQALILEPGDAGVESQARATEDAASPADVRTWQDGDSLKKVHWKLSMRKREIMVRTYEESMRSDTLILPDAACPDTSRIRRLYCEDALCEWTLACARAQLLHDHPVRMPVSGKAPFELSGQTAADFPRFWDKLSDMPFDGEFSYEQVLSVEMRRLLRTGAVILITTKLNAQLAEAALRMRRTRIQVSYIWVTDGRTEDDEILLARLSMAGVKMQIVDPWEAIA